MQNQASDHESGLHYNWHRYYDPATGRYLTPDPIGFSGGDLNLYSYVFQNPVNLTDPSGNGPFTSALCFTVDLTGAYVNALEFNGAVDAINSIENLISKINDSCELSQSQKTAWITELELKKNLILQQAQNQVTKSFYVGLPAAAVCAGLFFTPTP